MTNRSDLISLPTGLQSTGDPVPTNPFQADNPRHKVWSDATRIAEEETCRLRSDFVRVRSENFEALAVGTISLATGMFDIWARRGVQVVWGDDDVRFYDQWLYRYAESWLEIGREWCPETLRAEAFLNELKLSLIGRLERWKGYARSSVAEQKVNMARPKCSASGDLGNDHLRGLTGTGSLDSGTLAAESSALKTAVGTGEKEPSGVTRFEDSIAQGAILAVPVMEREAQAHDWEDIEISFLSDERVQISIRQHRETRNYEEMGFGSKKNGTPVLAWTALSVLARVGGVASVAADSREWATFEKRIQEIRKRLRRLFGLAGDPIPFSKKSRTSVEFGYRTRFKLGCRRCRDS